MRRINNLLITVLISLVINNYIFAQNNNGTHLESNGFLLVQAENFNKQSKDKVRKWHVVSLRDKNKDTWNFQKKRRANESSNGTYIELLPDTRKNHEDELIVGENFSNEPGKIAIISYNVNISKPGRYYVWVRAYSTGTEDNGLHVGLDGSWPESGRRMQWCNGKDSWYWESRQRTKEQHCGVPGQIYLDIDKPGKHEIHFSMREDGFNMDQWLISNDSKFDPRNVIMNRGSFGDSNTALTGELKKWHKITLTFDGPESSESDEDNPFFNYRLNVTFTHKNTGKTYVIPGYFAADGNAGQTSASSGNKWRVHFSPDEEGEWAYSVNFRKGNWVAVSDKSDSGLGGGFMDGANGSFIIDKTDKTGVDFRGRGRLKYVGERYLKFAETGEYFLKQGPDAPENFLAYQDFDGTFHNDGHKDNLVKTWEAHLQDWQKGDPTWKEGKGKALIGALNYLASKGLNSVSFLTNNIKGDDQNVFPYIDYDTHDRFDVSKLDQWEMVFGHAQEKGLFLHFKTLEMENQGLLDGGSVGAKSKLYYRELIARFGHHLALNWNLCEENGEWVKNHPTPPQDTQQRLAMIKYFEDHDPYHHHLVIHNGIEYDDLLGKDVALTGPSVQTHRADFAKVHSVVLHWLEESKKAGKQWAVAVDEPGDAQHSLLPDEEDPNHNIARKNALWGTLMAGGWGNEWYFGYDHAHSDLTCEDYRSRDLFWDQAKVALDFFDNYNIPYWEMINRNDLVGNSNNDNTVYALAKTGEIYVVYLNSANKASLDLSEVKGEYDVFWYDTKSGGELKQTKITNVSGGRKVELGNAPTKINQDWAIIVQRK